jgi:hypothetical protein
MRILIAAIMKGAVNYHRLFSPETEILTTVNQKSILKIQTFQKLILLFLQGLLHCEEIDKICSLAKGKKAHCKLVLDIDDYWELDEHHISKRIFTTKITATK